ncbi:GrpB family protein [Paenibacillus sp. 19GGS1-52]|uniref:GrpB family protein n=1 Tax=Paenibacillus sp. 19GGS1-52 TaxID=2758563 RepID=UPI001EFA62D8|nr:GrpB family protein [Paenibacillus sp. 19GGS1-52]ULO04686.1 GrpB family protein [Paenibacillus sp. 19GGS1-52]
MAEKTKGVEVLPYNPVWKTEFNRIKEQLLTYVGDLIIGIEHVGSTSIEGLSAKPIIDIDLVMESYEVLPEIIERLQQYGYEHQGNLGIEGREAFRRSENDRFMNYHLYVCPKNGKGYVEHIAFRDYLRSNTVARLEYEAVKLQLAEQYRHDIDAYGEGKTAIVTSILEKAMN